MNPKLNQPWIPYDRIEAIVQLEPAFVIAGLSFIAWVIYKLFLREASPDRHRNLKLLFINLAAHLGVFLGLFALYAITHKGAVQGNMADRVASYFGLATLISGSIVFVKASRILLFEYLFLGHMREGVPVLIVNLFTLVLSIVIAGWYATDIFGFKLTPLLATSAIFSLVLGLALQDTLGNLFAGVALQLDKPYEIGDWIELVQGGQHRVGQVQEITWRATVLVGLYDELIIVPNRTMSSAEISNFSATQLPIWRVQTMRIPYEADVVRVREKLLEGVKKAEGVLKTPEPAVFIREAGESWLVFRCAYCIADYGSQWKVGSNVLTSIVETLQSSGLGVAAHRIQIVKEGTA